MRVYKLCIGTDHAERQPVPISNTEVKPSEADDTAVVRPCESRTLPGYKRKPAGRKTGGLFYCVFGSAYVREDHWRSDFRRELIERGGSSMLSDN